MPEELRLEIDRLRLDEEWLGQASQFYNWSKKVADAQMKFDSAKAELSLTRAELDREVRDNPAVYGISKITETVVEQAVLATKEYVLATKKVIEARHELDVAMAAVSALDQRKRALTMLVELWVREYYSDPSPRTRSAEGSEFEKEAIRNRGRRRMQAESELDESKMEDRDVQ